MLNIHSNTTAFGAKCIKSTAFREIAAKHRQFASENVANMRKNASKFVKREKPTMVPENLFMGILKHFINLPK